LTCERKDNEYCLNYMRSVYLKEDYLVNLSTQKWSKVKLDIPRHLRGLSSHNPEQASIYLDNLQ
jgi:hypothetical protein